MNYLDNFKLWLKAKRYNPGTIRNYICDVNKYLNYIRQFNKSVDNLDTLFSIELLKKYIAFTANKKNRLRYLTSLAKFSQFAYERKAIDSNLFKIARKQFIHHKNTHLDPIVQIYQNTLHHQKKTSATIKNYINDIQQFINWIQPLKNGTE